MPRIYCAAQANGINLGLIDVDFYENIIQAFNYLTVDYGFTVPYYVHMKNGVACHME